MAHGTDALDARDLIEWAREKGIVLQSVRCGDCEVTLYDPQATAAALSPSAHAPGDDDRDEEDEQLSPLPPHYAAAAKSYGMKVPNG